MSCCPNMRAVLSAMLLMSVAWLPAGADMRLHWRYAGGQPVFNPGTTSVCPLPRGEQVTVLRRKGYDVGLAPRLRLCLWVAYSLVPEDVTNRVGRIGNFKRDFDVWEQVVGPEAYAGSRYDRGHMAPSQDMQYDVEVSRQSFWMANIVPQTSLLNRGTWKGLENRIHSKVVPDPGSGEVETDRVFVMAGPIFDALSLKSYESELKMYEKNGRKGRQPLLKPRACWKIYKCNAATFAVIFDQFGKAYSTTVKEISRQTGLSFFNDLPNGLKQYHESVCRMIYPNKIETENEDNDENQ